MAMALAGSNPAPLPFVLPYQARLTEMTTASQLAEKTK
jgi:hypothetical protein